MQQRQVNAGQDVDWRDWSDCRCNAGATAGWRGERAGKGMAFYRPAGLGLREEVGIQPRIQFKLRSLIGNLRYLRSRGSIRPHWAIIESLGHASIFSSVAQIRQNTSCTVRLCQSQARVSPASRSSASHRHPDPHIAPFPPNSPRARRLPLASKLNPCHDPHVRDSSASRLARMSAAYSDTHS